jgi:hypothetical protein
VNFGEIWTGLLEFVLSIIVPVWNDLIQYIPLLLIGVMILSILGLIGYWRRNGTANQSRVPKPRPSGRKPEDLHLPGPSLWPFVAPAGLLLMVGALAFGALQPIASFLILIAGILGTPIDWLLVQLGLAHERSAATLTIATEGTSSLIAIGTFGLGLTISVIGVIGWYLDAGKEYIEVEAGGHGHAQIGASSVASGPAWALEPPPGIHMPGPSAWPFLAPVGLFFIVLGFIFGPVLFVGGVIMAAIAALGWTHDADKELVEVEAHGHATPETRDPEKAWPDALIPIYTSVAAVVLVITLLPWLLTFLPSGGSSEELTGPSPVGMPIVTASAVTRFDIDEIATFANEPFTIDFDNQQPAVPHNIAIYETSAQEVQFFNGEIFEGPESRLYEIGALSAGEYFFVCSVHPPMTGTLYVK